MEIGSTKWKMGGEFGKWKDEMEIGRMALVGHRRIHVRSKTRTHVQICAANKRAVGLLAGCGKKRKGASS